MGGFPIDSYISAYSDTLAGWVIVWSRYSRAHRRIAHGVWVVRLGERVELGRRVPRRVGVEGLGGVAGMQDVDLQPVNKVRQFGILDRRRDGSGWC